ncbi:hypothetical protein ACETK8_20235 (plasmid) [Brevundimonas staleyi]|uniref:Uncharacterized protein n=1 Tax=Brevundimonas staleyi TaxID=74326 RepID=A0ABW0FNF4_9CAUL
MTVLSLPGMATVAAMVIGLFVVARAGLISWRRFGEATGGLLIGVAVVAIGQVAAVDHG